MPSRKPSSQERAERYVGLIRANVDRFYADDDHGRFTARQRVLWNMVGTAGLNDDVLGLLSAPVRP